MNDHTSGPAGARLPLAPVKGVVAETHDASSFVLDVPAELAETFRYRPGQFCTFRVHIDGDEQLRSYSMSSAPETDGDLTVTVKRVAGGLVSNWFLDHVRAGERGGAHQDRPGCSARRRRHARCWASAAAAASRRSCRSPSTCWRRPGAPVRLLYANRDRDSVIFDGALAGLGDRHAGAAARCATTSTPTAAS